MKTVKSEKRSMKPVEKNTQSEELIIPEPASSTKAKKIKSVEAHSAFFRLRYIVNKITTVFSAMMNRGEQDLKLLRKKNVQWNNFFIS